MKVKQVLFVLASVVALTSCDKVKFDGKLNDTEGYIVIAAFSALAVAAFTTLGSDGKSTPERIAQNKKGQAVIQKMTEKEPHTK